MVRPMCNLLKTFPLIFFFLHLVFYSQGLNLLDDFLSTSGSFLLIFAPPAALPLLPLTPSDR